MSKGLKVTIQTKPYLKKYLHKLYGDPLRFNSDNEFGICIAAFLHTPVSNFRVEAETGSQFSPVPVLAYKSHESKEVLKMRLDTYDAFIDIHLPKTFLTERRGGFEIKDQHIIVINKMFEKKFEAELWSKCLLLNIAGLENKEALLEVCNLYDIVIDEDITLEALTKKEFRIRKKMELSAPDLSSESVKKIIKKIILNTVRTGQRHS